MSSAEIALDRFVNRRTVDLRATTRSEIVTSIVAVVVFLSVIGLRHELAQGAFQQVALGLTFLWLGIVLFRYRKRLGRTTNASPAASGVEYYRAELEQRRDHLRNAWIWIGPMFLAMAVATATLFARSNPSLERLKNAVPIAIMLIVWTVMGVMRRSRQAREIQKEIDEIGS